MTDMGFLERAILATLVADAVGAFEEPDAEEK